MRDVSYTSDKLLKKVAFHTLGCKLNFAETSMLKKDFNPGKFKITSFDNKADIYVINTCSVTNDANKDCRKVVRKALRINPGAYVVVTGCYAQLDPDAIASIEGVDLVVGAKDKFDIVALAGNFEKSDTTIIHHTDVNEAVDFHNAFSSNDRTRVFLKIQDGCDYKCSFCTIPLARGKSRSPSVDMIVKQAQAVIDDGYKEIVLTGVNAGDFGSNTGESFLELLTALDALSELKRIRISSIEPNLLTNNIIELAASSTSIQPHFHIPLQSGSDNMLKIMKRRYDTSLYKERVETIRNKIPDACIGVDVITGHPGESSSLFEETCHFIQSLDVSYLHVFTYSERPNTLSANMTDQVAVRERKRRTQLLRNISKQKRYDFNIPYLGDTRPVLVEQKKENGRNTGWTDNYIRVSFNDEDQHVQPNEIYLCVLERMNPGSELVVARLVK